MTIDPDTKNWTWVLERPCPECGFDAAGVAFADIPRLTRDNAAAWPAVLARPDAAVRPRPDRWSALEYGCHVRDVFVRFAERFRLMREEDGPAFENWDQDATAIADRYVDQDPAVVAGELTAAGDRIADLLADVRADELSRTGRRSDGSVFTIESMARYFVHDPIHHRWDVDG